MALGVHSPTSLASGEAVTPKIVAEAKIGTSKSAELGWRPAAWLCSPAGGGPASFSHTFWDQNPAGLYQRGCGLGHSVLPVSPGKWETQGGRTELQREWA